MNRCLIVSYIFLVISLSEVEPHGYLSNPPARNAAWRYGFSVPANYDLMSLNCGGRGSKCSVCGDPFGSGYKPHETGGIYARQVIVKTYTMGSTIDIEVTITANHFGYFEFRVCPVTDNNVEVTQECLNQNQLVVNGNGFKRNLDFGERETTMTVKLPDGLTCERCVFQWYWKAQLTNEEYNNCADIKIVNGSGVVPSTTPITTTSTTTTTTTTTSTTTNTTTTTTTTNTTTTTTITTNTTISDNILFATTSGLSTELPSVTTSEIRCFRGNGYCNFYQ